MTRAPFLWPLALVLSAIMLAAVLLAFWAKPVDAPASAEVPAGKPADKARTGDGFGAVDVITSGSANSPTRNAVAAGLAEDDGEPEQPWEKAINQLLDSDDENEKVASALVALAPTLPLEGQVESIQHMVNLLDDEHYALAQNMVLNPGLRPELREVIFSDVLDRPNSVKLPLLLALLGSPGHPLLAEAHTNLQSVIGQDLGYSPGPWAQPVQEFLAREAADEAEADVALKEAEASGDPQ